MPIFILLYLLLMSGASSLFAETPIDSTSNMTKTFTLDELLSIALQHSQIIKKGQGIVEQKEGDVLQASSYPNPTISLQGGRGSTRDPSMGTSITERYVTLSQPLEWPGTRQAEQHAAQAGIKSAEAGLAENKLNVIAGMKNGFYDLLLRERESALVQENIKTITQLQKAIKARVKAGEAPPFEAVKMKVEVLKVQKALIRTNGAIRSAKAKLNSLTAGRLGHAFSVRGEFETRSHDLNSTTLVEQSFFTHPALLKGQKRVEEAKERHQQERQARIPNITLNGSYQRDIGREAFIGGISFPIPLWNQRQGEIAQAKGRMRQEEANLLGTRTRLQRGISQHIENSKIAVAQISTYENGLLKQAREALRIAQVSFKYGEASLLDVLDAQRILRETQLEYMRAKYDLSIALTELERLTGKNLE
ncbi:MAG: TolC family protein [Nitrospirales bacterium]